MILIGQTHGTDHMIAFKKESEIHPNYALGTAILLIDSRLVSELQIRFASSVGYKLYPDVLPFFRDLRQSRNDQTDTSRFSRCAIGIITNSDNRVPAILSSLGLQVGPTRYGIASGSARLDMLEDNDIQFIVMSYDVGFEKPDPRIFKAAENLMLASDFIHVGDDPVKDIFGASESGWKCILLDRDNHHHESKHLERVANLVELRERYLT
ncbi:hypothetical protein MMC12_005127 [Toensbergia leucococca]|nr:hypothetical protein [Toensbergia leucococca]